MATNSRPVKAQLSRRPVRDDNRRLSDRVAAELVQRILRGDLEQGTQLPTEGELCEIFDVSRTVVRDAVRTLIARGLLDVRAGRGTMILPPSDESFSEALFALLVRSQLTMGDVMDARAAIETQVVPLAATGSTTAQRRAIAEAFERLRRAVTAEDWHETHRADQAFHLTLLRATNLPALEIMLKPLQHVIMVCSVPVDSHSEDAWQLDRHRAIAEAIETGDPVAVRTAMEEHFAYLKEPEYTGIQATSFARSPAVEALVADDFRPEGLYSRRD
jgi:GntR family transcriptional repressor for pyruvate dehydrogenase complex